MIVIVCLAINSLQNVYTNQPTGVCTAGLIEQVLTALNI